MSMTKEHPAPSPASKESLRLWLRILKVQRMVEGELRERFRTEFDTTLPRFDVMSALYRYRDGMKMSELSRALKVSNGNVTGIVDRLADDGLALRVPVPGDRRAAMVRLTKRGIEVFEAQAAAHEVWVHEALGGLEGEESAMVARMLDHALTEGDDDAQ
ncbi:MarR family winged helix-turn-helix transcriptional regulator [Roseovarius indicus]|uniref:MarR family transcriptional regulator n=2 Tax=Roseovarius indicus TaxID=540747 RepID=A0A0T5PC94_9RHOB|nr:MarR family transcriptional regulator [Roseovarius indicus]KRS18873.1 MarR family transcriptional regulator [Roseovarius indicus]